MPLLLCPNDNTSMQSVSRSGVEFDMCPACRGVWLDRGELEKLMAAERSQTPQAPLEGPIPTTMGRPPSGSYPPAGYAYGERGERGEYGGERGEHGYGHGHRRRSLFDIFD